MKGSKQTLDECIEAISKIEPTGLYRYRKVHIEKLDVSSDSISSTLTFSYITEAGPGGINVRKTHWCFYNPKYKKELREAIEGDYTLEIVIARFIDAKINETFFGGDSGEIVDWLFSVSRIVHSDNN